MRLPSNNVVSLHYGATSSPYSPSNPHAGTDYSHSPDINWYAPEDVIVTAKGWMGDCGNGIDLLSLDGKRKYRGCHNQTTFFQVGNPIKEGQRVGVMGKTGFADGVHLHFVMWVNGNRVDPDKTIKEMTRMSDESIKYVFMSAGMSEAEASKQDFNYWRANLSKLGKSIYDSSWNDTFRKKALGYDDLKEDLEEMGNPTILKPGTYKVE